MKSGVIVVTTMVAALVATAVSGPAAASPSAGGSVGTTGCVKPDPPRFGIGTHNVHGGGPEITFTRFAAIIGWQETSKDGSRWRMRKHLGDNYRHYVPQNSNHPAAKYNAISWKRDRFAFLKARFIKTHGGRRKVTPPRYINLVHLRHRRTGQKIIFINTHFISGAFRSGSTYTQWRKDRWYEHRDRLKKLLRNLRGWYGNRPIFLVGDFNRHGYVNFDGVRVYPVRMGTRKPIDQIYAGRKGRGKCLARLSKQGSDHYRWRAVAYW